MESTASDGGYASGDLFWWDGDDDGATISANLESSSIYPVTTIPSLPCTLPNTGTLSKVPCTLAKVSCPSLVGSISDPPSLVPCQASHISCCRMARDTPRVSHSSVPVPTQHFHWHHFPHPFICTPGGGFWGNRSHVPPQIYLYFVHSRS